jgi:DNA-binding IclR family transcriptional regulator
MVEPRTTDGASSVLGRATELLRAFTDEDDAVPLAELARRTRLPRSTVHRIAGEMVSLRLLERTSDGYRIGTALWELGELAPVSLYEATGENVHLAVLDGHEALYIARVAGTRSIPTLTRMGGRLPLHTTGVGKALLASRDEAWLTRFFRSPLERETSFSVTDEQRLREQLLQARALGYATTRQEMTLGNISVAAALPETPGMAPAALGVVIHLARVDERRMAPLVIRTAAAIARELQSH